MEKRKQKETKKPRKKLRMLPTLREKKHYLVLIIQDRTNKARAENIEAVIDDAIINFIGILGYAKAGVLFVERGKTNAKPKQLYFILSVITKYVDSIKAAITLIKKPYIRCVGVSGTLKKSKRFLIV